MRALFSFFNAKKYSVNWFWQREEVCTSSPLHARIDQHGKMSVKHTAASADGWFCTQKMLPGIAAPALNTSSISLPQHQQLVVQEQGFHAQALKIKCLSLFFAEAFAIISYAYYPNPWMESIFNIRSCTNAYYIVDHTDKHRK